MTRQFAPGDPLIIRATATDDTAARLNLGQRASVPFGPGDVVETSVMTSSSAGCSIEESLDEYVSAICHDMASTDPGEACSLKAEREGARGMLLDAIRAALAGPSGNSLPKGWKLVPVEPTEEMALAGCRTGGYPLSVYKAMLNAAPPALARPAHAPRVPVPDWQLQALRAGWSAPNPENDKAWMLLREAASLIANQPAAPVVANEGAE